MLRGGALLFWVVKFDFPTMQGRFPFSRGCGHSLRTKWPGPIEFRFSDMRIVDWCPFLYGCGPRPCAVRPSPAKFEFAAVYTLGWCPFLQGSGRRPRAVRSGSPRAARRGRGRSAPAAIVASSTGCWSRASSARASRALQVSGQSHDRGRCRLAEVRTDCSGSTLRKYSVASSGLERRCFQAIKGAAGGEPAASRGRRRPLPR